MARPGVSLAAMTGESRLAPPGWVPTFDVGTVGQERSRWVESSLGLTIPAGGIVRDLGNSRGDCLSNTLEFQRQSKSYQFHLIQVIFLRAR